MTLTTTGARVRKTTPEQRRDIRDRYRAGDQVKEIAADHGVAPAAISYHCRDIDRPFPHGTNAGFQRHKATGIPMCEPCRDARQESERAYRLARLERTS